MSVKTLEIIAASVGTFLDKRILVTRETMVGFSFLSLKIFCFGLDND